MIKYRKGFLWRLRSYNSTRNFGLQSTLCNSNKIYVHKHSKIIFNIMDEKKFITNQTGERSEPGFIVVDLETDGLIATSKTFGTRYPQILQIGFAPLEELAHRSNTVSFYTQPIDPIAFNTNLKKTLYLQKFYNGYNSGSYFVKREGESDCKVSVVPLKEGIDRLVTWKKKLYEDRPVYLIAHNAIKFDKLVLEHHLRELNLFDSFQSYLNFAGWIDSLDVIRGLPDILRVLGYPYMKENDMMWFIRREWPFSLSKLVEILSKRYNELSITKKRLQWPIFDLSYLYRGEEDEKWLHHFSREVMVHQGRDLVKQLISHRAGDDVMALVCILHQLNLYPTFRKAHFKKL